MSQYTTGTISMTAGSNIVTGAGVEWSQISAGDLLVRTGDNVAYEIATITASTSTLTLTTNYPTTRSSQNYTIFRDFTPNLSLPLLNQGDAQTAEIYNKAMALLDAESRGGFAYRGKWATLVALTAGVTDPAEGNYAYVTDGAQLYLWTGAAWEIWSLTGITVGPAGADGFTPEPDWVSDTQLRFTIQGGGYTTAVELKGEKGDAGGLTFQGGWSAETTYYENDVVTYDGAVYVCILENTNYQPDTSTTRWTLFLEQFGTGSTISVDGTFVDADLDASDCLAISHGIGSRAVTVQVFDNNWNVIGPDEITATSTTVITVDLSSFAPLTGTWAYTITGKTPA